MKTYFFVSVILIFVTLVYLKLARKFKIVDTPNHRSSHSKPTIRGGGIIFFIAVLLFFLMNNFSYPYFTLGITLIAIVSFIDDIKTLSSKIRMPFQFLSIALILYELGLPIELSVIYFFTLIVGVGFINVYNFMDGINGITALYSLSLLFLFYGLNEQANVVSPDLIKYSIISLLVFSFFNYRKKAVFFAGDIGSISMSMILLFIGLSLIIQLESPIIILAVVVYGADSMLTILYRVSKKENIFAPHRNHIYQKFVDNFNISHRAMSFYYFAVQMIVNTIVYYFYEHSFYNQWIIIISVVVVFITLYVLLFFRIDKVKK